MNEGIVKKTKNDLQKKHASSRLICQRELQTKRMP